MNRRPLLAFAALAPLCLAAGPALAQTTISGTSTTPVATSTAGDVTVAAGATLTSSSTTPAITIDSNNAVVNSGSVAVSNNVNNGVGVLINGGVTGSYSGAGNITLSEDYTATDTANSDGIVEAPFAQGTGRYGVRLVGPAPFTGDIVPSGAITVKGNDSYGVSLESQLIGSLGTGAVSVVGDRSIAVRETAGVTGNVTLNNTISATGQGAQGVSLTGDIGGQLRLYSGVTATGYSSTTRPTDPTKVQATPANLQLSGPAFTIGADVAGGVYFGGAPAGTASGSTDDLNGDGIADGSEGTSAITSYSSAPALLVGSATRNVSLGQFGTADFANNYGLIVRGAITGAGVYDGFSATAVQIGGQGGAVNIAGGMRVTGAITATARQADATAIHIGAGATVPEIRLEGAVNASLISTGASTASAVLVDAGAVVNTLTNSGAIAASATGTNASATAIMDRSGQITTLVNSGTINVGVVPTNAGEALTGAVNAIDLRANTTGVTLTQYVNSSGNVPAIVGNVLLGSGPNTVNLLGGSMAGALQMGGAAGAITLDNGAIYRGALSYGGTNLAINIANGVFQNDNAGVFRASSLNVGANSTLIVAADPANNRATQYLVSGAANIASGAKIGVSVQSLLTTTQTYTIIASPNLTLGATDNSLLATTPYMFAASIGSNAAAGEVTLTLRRRTAAELGLNRAQSSAFEAVYASLANDAGLRGAVLNQTTATGLTSAYNQLLPQHAGGQFVVGQLATEAIARTTAEADHFQNADGAGGPWLQEVVIGVDKKLGDANAYRGWGVGFAGGWEVDTRGLGALGVSAAFVTSNLHDPTQVGDSSISTTQIEGGLYWRGEIGGLRFDARAAGGAVQFRSGREAIISTTTDGIAAFVNRKNKANWSGYTLSGRLGVGYEAKLGWLFLRPQAHADYYRLSEDAYAEKFGGDGFDLTYGARKSQAVTATTSLVAGANLGGDGSGLRWRPQLEVGWRKAVSGGFADTTANFAGGQTFTLSPEDARKGGAIARLGLKADSEYFELMLEGGGQMQGKTRTADLRFAARMLF